MNALRGAIVVIIALVIAVVILARGLDEAETTNQPAETTDTTQPAAQPPPPAAEPPPQPAAEPPPQPAAEPPPPQPAADLGAAAPDDMFGEAPPPPPPTHNRDEVRVLVANGTTVCGAAGRLATSLSAQGYNVLPATNADNAAEISSVYYVDEYGADAGVVASLIQVASSQVLPLPASPPTAPGEAHVVIHLGADDVAQPNC